MRPLLLIPIVLTAAIGAIRQGVADDEPSAQIEPAQQEAIVLEPVAGPDAPVVQLLPNGPVEPWDPREIGEFTLIDQNGDEVTNDDLLGTQWVASFIFTRCQGQNACPQLVRSIYDLRKTLQDVDVRFVTITVDPEYDTVERMRRYSEIYEAEPPGWLFLTGEKDQVYRLVRSGFRVAAWENFGTERLPGAEFVHSMSLVHVDAEGVVVGMYDSRDDSERRILQQVLLGRQETPPEFRPVPPVAAVQTTSPETQTAPVPPSASTDELGELPGWAQRLPATNAMLNALATLLLLVGFSAIKAGQVALHRRMMLTAFGVSVAFLACYLTYHFALNHYTGTHGKSFEATGGVANVYYAVLISHIVLAATVPFLAIITIYRALAGQLEQHRRIARITFPVWLYVSVTGVIIYWMLYHLGPRLAA